ncbi:hypothetical protein VTI74DRAFT_5398 [Chaetomium olivicolor]
MAHPVLSTRNICRPTLMLLSCISQWHPPRNHTLHGGQISLHVPPLAADKVATTVFPNLRFECDLGCSLLSSYRTDPHQNPYCLTSQRNYQWNHPSRTTDPPTKAVNLNRRHDRRSGWRTLTTLTSSTSTIPACCRHHPYTPQRIRPSVLLQWSCPPRETHLLVQLRVFAGHRTL